MTDIQAQAQARAQQVQAQAQQVQAQAQAQQAQAQQAQAQQAQAQQAQKDQVSIPISTGGSSGSSDSSNDVKSEIGKLEAEKGQYERLIKAEIDKFENDLIDTCLKFNIDLMDQGYKNKIENRKGSSGEDKFCMLAYDNERRLRYGEEIEALQLIKAIKEQIMGTQEGKALFEDHDNITFQQILEFAIICHEYRVTVDNYVRISRIINEFTQGKKLDNYIPEFSGINITNSRGDAKYMDNILSAAIGKVRDKIGEDRPEYTKMFIEQGLDIEKYFPAP